MNRFFGKLERAAMIAAVVCLIAGGALAKDPERPYRGRAELRRVSVGECDPGVVGGILPPELAEGTLIATHEGLSEVSVCTAVTEFVTPVLVKVEGQGVTTVANGDEVNFTFSGAVDISSDPCVARFTAIIAGGTGRFEGASGLLDGVSTQPWSAPFTCGPESSDKLSGTIEY